MSAERYEPGPVFVSAGVRGAHFARCWPCIGGECPGGEHPWADAEDLAHAEKIGKPETAEGPCACHCTSESERHDEPGPDDLETVSLDGPPCHLCGAAGACGNDDLGRPWIHASWDEDEAELVSSDEEEDHG